MTDKKKQPKPKKKKKVELKPYQIESELKKMYPKMSAGEISRKYGVSRAVVLRKLKKFNFDLSRTRTSSKAGKRRDDVDRSFHKRDYLKKQLEAGMSIYAIAKQCDTHYIQVKHFVEKFGLLPMVEGQKTKKKVLAKHKPVKKSAKKGLEKTEAVIKKHTK